MDEVVPNEAWDEAKDCHDDDACDNGNPIAIRADERQYLTGKDESAEGPCNPRDTFKKILRILERQETDDEKTLRTEKMVPPVYPLLKRAMIIVRSPVFGPKVAINAGRTTPTTPKHSSTAMDSLNGVESRLVSFFGSQKR